MAARQLFVQCAAVASQGFEQSGLPQQALERGGVARCHEARVDPVAQEERDLADGGARHRHAVGQRFQDGKEGLP